MSFIVKGLDMPCCGEEIRISIYGHGAKYGKGASVVATESYLDDDGDRRCITLDVEAIQIPKGHGRLIDGDRLITDLEEWKQNSNNDKEAVTFVSHFQGIIRTAPTILEAEE